jgi:Uma2 family endonuclease
MALTKPAGTWTYEDLFALPDDGRRYEIIEGELYEMPAPTGTHALTIMSLISVLLPMIARLGGQLVTAPIDAFFAGANPVQPDLLAILPGNPARIVERGVEGSPDFVVEVLSPSNRVHDILTKRALYGRAGIREYWIVDPVARSIEILTLDGGVLREYGTASGHDLIDSPLLGKIPVATDDLFPIIEG